MQVTINLRNLSKKVKQIFGGSIMKKSTIAIMLVIVLFGHTGQAFASQTETIPDDNDVVSAEQRLTLITTITPSLRVSGTTVTYGLVVTCISSVNSIKVVLHLQQLKNGVWSDYGSSWNASSSTSYLSTDGTKIVASGFSYRLKVTITASNGTETGYAVEYS
jgi:choline-glycine betaine transporter